MRIAVLDTETNGTESWRHSVWEIGAVFVDTEDTTRGLDYRHDAWPLGPALGKSSPDALRINAYHRRVAAYSSQKKEDVAAQWAKALSGYTLASCNVSFDSAFLTRFLLENGQVPTWGYSPIDVKSLAYGRRRSLLGQGTSALLKAFRVDEARCLAYHGVETMRHSALADAYLANELLHRVMGWGSTHA